ncbi:remorin 4.1-like [Populus alba x Populus x berolinensis]|nr:remorin 4.1-like [Populus alba x Populus x berolinensis]
MLSAQRPSSSSTTTSGDQTSQDHGPDNENEQIRDIHALTPPDPPPRNRWETGSSTHHGSYSMSMSGEGASSENFTTMSREFNALVVAGSAIGTSNTTNNSIFDHSDIVSSALLSRIGEDDHGVPEEINALAIVPDNNPSDPEPSSRRLGSGRVVSGSHGGEVSVMRVKKEEVETKITAWQNAKIAKINNRLKREDAIINGWESEQVQKSTSWMKKVERKLEEKRARALEKMQNEVAKAHRKAEERRASAEAKRGTKVARVLEVANLMRAVGRAPAKRSFF